MKVYLYELDSVRNSAAEIQVAQERLFKETVGSGKAVVLSQNQLLDGMGFTGALYGDKGEENYQTILKLFQSGLVKVCKFTDHDQNKVVESLAEYWLCNMRKNDFATSGVDITPEGKHCLEEALVGVKPYILDKWAEGKTKEEGKADAEYIRLVTKMIFELGLYDIWEEEDTGKN